MEDMSAMQYEILIRRAYNCNRYGKPGADKDIFQNLATEEYYLKEDPDNKKLQRSFSKSIEKVKGYIIDALKKGIKVSGKKDTSQLLVIIDAVQISNNYAQLSEQVNNAHKAFDTLKIVMN